MYHFSAGYGNCLHDVPRVKRYRKHIKRIQKKHAGSLYSANKQCELVYGKGYHLCPFIVSIGIFWNDMAIAKQEWLWWVILEKGHNIIVHEPVKMGDADGLLYSQTSLYRHLLQQQNSFSCHFDLHKKAFLFIVCILYNSKCSLTSKYFGTNSVIVKRVHSCITGVHSSITWDLNLWSRWVCPYFARDLNYEQGGSWKFAIYLFFFSSFYCILLRTNHWAISVSPPKLYGKKDRMKEHFFLCNNTWA